METKTASKLVLYYCTSAEKADQIDFLCHYLGIQSRMLKKEEGNMTLGALCNMADVPPQETAQPEELSEILIFMGLNSEALDDFLSSYKAAEIEPIDLKAIVTPTNFSWTLKQLTEELKKERLQLLFGNKTA